jgi:hypothetical protein
MARQPWTTSEIAYLMANFQRGQSRAVAEALGRSQTSVVRDWLVGYVD